MTIGEIGQAFTEQLKETYNGLTFDEIVEKFGKRQVYTSISPEWD